MYYRSVLSSLTTEFYNPKAFITHAALLRQTFVHCGRFPTAASRRSLGRVSVPMWPFILSDRLLIVALVGLYPHQLANQTQAHLQAEAFSEASFSKCLMRYSYIHSVLAPLSKCCPHLEGRLLTRYSPVRHLVFTEINTPFDLHVLSTPPAFVLSQDQTLQNRYFEEPLGSRKTSFDFFNLVVIQVTRSHHRKGDLTRTSVNNIQFSKFVSLSQRQLVYFIRNHCFCQQLFYFLSKTSGC